MSLIVKFLYSGTGTKFSRCAWRGAECETDGTSRVQRGIDRRWSAVGNSIDNVNRISCEFALGAMSLAIDPATIDSSKFWNDWQACIGHVEGRTRR